MSISLENASLALLYWKMPNFSSQFWILPFLLPSHSINHSLWLNFVFLFNLLLFIKHLECLSIIHENVLAIVWGILYKIRETENKYVITMYN